MGFGNNKSSLNKFGVGVVGSHERGLPAEGVSPRGAVFSWNYGVLTWLI